MGYKRKEQPVNRGIKGDNYFEGQLKRQVDPQL